MIAVQLLYKLGPHFTFKNVCEKRKEGKERKKKKDQRIISKKYPEI